MFAQTDEGHESPGPSGAQVLFLTLTTEVNIRLSGPGLRVWTRAQRARCRACARVCLRAQAQEKMDRFGHLGHAGRGLRAPSVYLSHLIFSVDPGLTGEVNTLCKCISGL